MGGTGRNHSAEGWTIHVPYEGIVPTVATVAMQNCGRVANPVTTKPRNCPPIRHRERAPVS